MDSKNPEQKQKFDAQGVSPLQRADYYYKNYKEAFKEQFLKAAGAQNAFNAGAQNADELKENALRLWEQFEQDYNERNPAQIRNEIFQAQKNLIDTNNLGQNTRETLKRNTRNEEESRTKNTKMREPNEFLKNN